MKYYLIILLIITFFLSVTHIYSEEIIIITSEGGEVDLESKCTYTIDDKNISKDKFKLYLKIKPYHKNSIFKSIPSLEYCNSTDKDYYECRNSANIASKYFFKNAEVNISKGDKILQDILKAPYHPILADYINYYKEYTSFHLWINKSLYNFYRTWNSKYLKETHNHMSPIKICPDALETIDRTSSIKLKYELSIYRWYNKMNAYFNNKMNEKYSFIDHYGVVDVSLWNEFLKKYNIKQNCEYTAD